jgi:isoamylase
MLPPVSFTQTEPLTPGVTFTTEGARFVVFSQNALAIDLCLYDSADGRQEIGRVRMRKGGNHHWHATLREVSPGTLYGYRAQGPWHPERGLRFNAKKLLLDPYARAIIGLPNAADHMLNMPDPRHPPGSIDNGQMALKSVVVNETFDWQGDRFLHTPWQDTVIYELHVKGFTQTHPGLPTHLRGTYAGLAHPLVTNYLRELGITALQLLPVHAHLDDAFLIERGLTNFWGYNTLGFFAPHGGYASSHDPQEQIREFKGMVKALHAAGIEVILDVVYNHTAEGDPHGPTMLFRGLDDAMYYRQDADHNYLNLTGCGNSVDSAKPAGLRLILDSLRYWVTEMHVDGFRFDLAVTVARDEHDAYSQHAPFLAAVAQDPILSRVKLIAEPWDISKMDSYQVGGFPAPWRELNGKFRDTVRKFWRGDSDTTADFAKRFCGSQDIYGSSGRPPLASINLITSHDGFTLLDLVSYSRKHNLANGEGNRDGDDHNHSVNCGVEGPSDDPIVQDTRARLRRSLMATLLLSTGVPFIHAGDERGRTQQGNNNAYCQDNELSWLDWTECDESMLSFTRQLLQLRRKHHTLRRFDYFNGRLNPASGLPDVTWLEGNGSLLCHDEWHDPSRCHFGALLDGIQGEAPILLFFNRGSNGSDLMLPGNAETRWKLVFDTSGSLKASEDFLGDRMLHVGGASLVCLQLASGQVMTPAYC